MPWPIIAAAAAPIALGLLNAGGQVQTNRANRAMVREQMAFQERMSSTAAQRSVEDYRRAGLNPALAYERTASSPSGASATMGDVVAAGVNSAQSARTLNQQLAIAKRQADADFYLTREQAAAAKAANQRDTAAAVLNDSNTALARQAHEFNRISQPLHLRERAANALLQELNIPRSQNQAEFEKLLGKGSPGLASAKTLAEILKMLFGR